jgi:plastocyanin
MRRSLIPLYSLSTLLTLSLVLTACGDTDSDATAHDGMSSSPMDGMGDGMGHGQSSPVTDGARRIEVDATSFQFDPDEITVEAGEDIAIVLTSDDVLHDFTIDDLDAHVTADEGETAEGGLRADEPGRHAYYCSVAGHRDQGMEGTLIVEAA